MKKIIEVLFYPFVYNKMDLERKIWHRLIKVYFVVFMFFIWFVSIFFLDLHQNIQNISFVNKNKVEEDIQKAQANKRTKENLFWDMETFMRDNPWVNDEEAYKVVLDVYKERGWSIEWIDINQELQALWWTQPMQSQMQTQMQSQEQEKYFILNYLFDILKLILILYITLIFGQFIYYKMFLYVIYWKNNKVFR